MQMIGHETYLPYINHGVIVMYLGNLIVENSLSQWRRIEARLSAVTLCGTHNLAKDRASASNHHGHLISPGHRIVVPKHSPCLTTIVHILFNHKTIIIIEESVTISQRYNKSPQSPKEPQKNFGFLEKKLPNCLHSSGIFRNFVTEIRAAVKGC